MIIGSNFRILCVRIEDDRVLKIGDGVLSNTEAAFLFNLFKKRQHILKIT